MLTAVPISSRSRAAAARSVGPSAGAVLGAACGAGGSQARAAGRGSEPHATGRVSRRSAASAIQRRDNVTP